DAKGIAGLGKDLTTSAFANSLPDAELILFLTRGRPASDSLNTTGVDMPPRGGNPALTDQDLADIAAFVRTLEQ
ncbi:MAG TPA: cytochrome c, partial [Anaerolineales bacterium]|nr:cytochrome c [Anaerolineales bacterium]